MSVIHTKTSSSKAWFETHKGEAVLTVATALAALAAGGLALYFGLHPSHVVQLMPDLALSLPLLITGSAGVVLGTTLIVEIARLSRKGPASMLEREVHKVSEAKSTVVLFYKKGTNPNPRHVEYYQEKGYVVIKREVWGSVEELNDELKRHDNPFVHAIGLSLECGNRLASDKKVKGAVFENTPAFIHLPVLPPNRVRFVSHETLDLFFMSHVQ